VLGTETGEGRLNGSQVISGLFDPSRHPWLTLILLAIVVRLTLLVAVLIAHGGSGPLIAVVQSRWSQWDVFHYSYIATHGYPKGGDGDNAIVWLPLYPFLVRLVMLLGLGVHAAEMLVSNLSSIAAGVILYQLARQDDQPEVAWRAAAFWTIFPTAYFFVTGYSEGVFCLLVFGSILALRRYGLVPAGAIAGLATATRLTGMALLPAIAFEAGRPLLKTRIGLRSLLTGTLAVVLVPAGFAVYLLINLRVYGNPFYFGIIEKTHFFEQVSLPWDGVPGAIGFLVTGAHAWDRLTLGAAQLLAAATFFVVAAAAMIKQRAADAAFMWTFAVLNTAIGFWIGEPRYLLAAYPLFILLGRIRSPVVQSLLVGVFLSAMVVFAIAFTEPRWAF
jgi:hypothetical protein